MSRHLSPSARLQRFRGALRASATIATATCLVGLSGGLALGAPAANDNKQTICHRTNSNTHPYVANTPAKSGDLHGHAGHTGPVWDATLKAQHIKWGDIIPPFDYSDGDTIQHFPGLNWTEAGQAIFNNGCAPLAPAPPPVLSLTVVKSNDANTDGTFHDTETAAAPAASVPFTVTVTNTNDVSVTIDSLTDAVGDTAVPFTCTSTIIGTTLAPHTSATCAFTISAYSPAGGLSKTNTATVVGHQGDDAEEGDPSTEIVTNTVTASDTSTVMTALAGPPGLSLRVIKSNDANGDGSFSGTETAPSPGQDVHYRVVVTNTSAVTVAIDGLTDVVGAAAAVPVTCTPAFPATLAPDASATCDFTLPSSSPAAGGSLTDTVIVTGHQADDPANTVTERGSSTVLTPQPPAAAPDLAIVKTGPAGTLKAGENATYTLTVTNDGTAPADSVVVDDALPANTTLQSISATGWTCTGSGVHCTLNTALAPASSASMTVVVTLANDFAATAIVNTATVSPTDSTPGDNTSTVTTGVTHAPDLSVVKSAPDSVTAGASLTWGITVMNRGDAPATAVTVTDVLPLGVGAGTLSAAGWTCTGSTDISCTLDAPLAAGDIASLTISVTVPLDFTAASVSNTAVVSPPDTTPADNTSTVTTTVIQTSTGGGGITIPPVTGGGGITTPPVTGGGGITTPPVTGGGGSIIPPVAGGGGATSEDAETLPFTGAPLADWGLDGAGLMMAGWAMVVLGRRRRNS